MSPRIVFVTDFPDAADVAREMAPSGFELVIAPARSAEYKEAMKGAEYLVGFVDGLVDTQLYKDGDGAMACRKQAVDPYIVEIDDSERYAYDNQRIQAGD